MFRPVTVFTAISLITVTGCSTSYVPRPGPRVALVRSSGNPAYMRDGKLYEGGAFGGEIVEAVSGVPEAEEQARTFKGELIGGFVATLGGGISMLAGLATYATAPHSGNSTYNTMGTALLVGGVAAYCAGLILSLDAPSHMFDAINIYNDSIPPYGYLPSGAYPNGHWVPQVAPPPTAGAPPSPGAPGPWSPVAPLPAPSSPPAGTSLPKASPPVR